MDTFNGLRIVVGVIAFVVVVWFVVASIFAILRLPRAVGNAVQLAVRTASTSLFQSRYIAIHDPKVSRIVRYRMRPSSPRTPLGDAEDRVYRALCTYLMNPNAKRSKHLVYVNGAWQTKEEWSNSSSNRLPGHPVPVEESPA